MVTTPAEYLTLLKTGAGFNESAAFSILDAYGRTFTTSWTRVRVDPATLVVTTDDFTFSTALSASYQFRYGEVTCLGDSATVNVDLTGTPFSLVEGFVASPGQYGGSASWTRGVPADQVMTVRLTGLFANLVPASTNGTARRLHLAYRPAGVVGQWFFSRDAVDTSGNGNDLAGQGGVALTVDRFGADESAYRFGTGLLSAADAGALDLTGDYSITLWAKAEALTPAAALVSKGSGYVLRLSDQAPHDVVELNGSASGVAGTVGRKLDTAVWHHIAATQSGTAVKIYLDGKLAYSGTGTAATANGDPLEIGRGFQGALDDVRLFNRALTADEAAALAGQ
ncbi:MAG: hypothetical protein QM765_28960 [Myxococcales bacterium]